MPETRYVVVRENGTGGDDPRDFDPALVSDSEKIWENYDPDRLVRAFRESAGVFHIPRDRWGSTAL